MPIQYRMRPNVRGSQLEIGDARGVAANDVKERKRPQSLSRRTASVEEVLLQQAAGPRQVCWMLGQTLEGLLQQALGTGELFFPKRGVAYIVGGKGGGQLVVADDDGDAAGEPGQRMGDQQVLSDDDVALGRPDMRRQANLHAAARFDGLQHVQHGRQVAASR